MGFDSTGARIRPGKYPLCPDVISASRSAIADRVSKIAPPTFRKSKIGLLADWHSGKAAENAAGIPLETTIRGEFWILWSEGGISEITFAQERGARPLREIQPAGANSESDVSPQDEFWQLGIATRQETVKEKKRTRKEKKRKAKKRKEIYRITGHWWPFALSRLEVSIPKISR